MIHFCLPRRRRGSFVFIPAVEFVSCAPRSVAASQGQDLTSHATSKQAWCDDVWGSCELYIAVVNCSACTEANFLPPLPDESGRSNQEHMSSIYRQRFFTFQQIGLRCFDVCESDSQHCVRPQYLHKNIKPDNAVTWKTNYKILLYKGGLFRVMIG